MNRQVDLRGGKYPMEDCFQFCAINTSKFVGGHHFNVRQQVRRVLRGVGNASFNPSTSNANLVDQLAMFRYERVC